MNVTMLRIKSNNKKIVINMLNNAIKSKSNKNKNRKKKKTKKSLRWSSYLEEKRKNKLENKMNLHVLK